MIDPAEIPQITGDMAALTQHAAALSQVGTGFADTGAQVHAAWQAMAPFYVAPEAEALFAATTPIPAVTASVGEDLRSIGSALSSYAAEVTGIQTSLRALQGEAAEFLSTVGANPDWRSNAAGVDWHNRILGAVNAAVAAFQDAERRCANAILALYSDLRYVADNGDGFLAANEHGATRESLDAALAAGQALPWGTAEEHDRGFLGDVGAFLGGAVEGGLQAFYRVRGGVGEARWENATGLGALIGLGPDGWSWETAGTAWAGLNTLALAFTPFGAINTLIDLPFQPRGSVQDGLVTAGKGLIAYDVWAEDPARATGKAAFNILTAIFGTKGAGASLRGTGGVAAGGGFADVAQAGAGLAQAGGKLPDLGTLTAAVLQRIPGLHIPHVDLPNTDLSPTHIDTPHAGPAGASAPHIPSVEDALPPGAVLTPDGFVPGPYLDPPPAGGPLGHDGIGGGHADAGPPGHYDGPGGFSDRPAGSGPGTPLGDPLTFRDNAEAAAYGAREWNAYAESLPAEQRAAVLDYTMNPPHYPSYVDINGYLRNPASTPATPALLNHIDEIDRALAGHPIPETVLVARGTGLEHLGAHPLALKGTVQTELAYTSTSLGDAAFAGKPATIHLTVPAGTPALWAEKVSAYAATERELLLGRGIMWRVDDVIEVPGTGQYHIYGTVFPG